MRDTIVLDLITFISNLRVEYVLIVVAQYLLVQIFGNYPFHSAYFHFCLQDGSEDVKKTSVYEEILMYLLTDPVRKYTVFHSFICKSSAVEL